MTDHNHLLDHEQAVRENVLILRQARPWLAQSIRDAREAGATIPMLCEWTGLSSRAVYDLLGHPRKKEGTT